ncbi:Nonribosomal peptide synthetase dtxS1 [Beauveria bassiana]|nr:Nonribosomal peptide synthetase dtxS1 [Beauveria bassiana]
MGDQHLSEAAAVGSGYAHYPSNIPVGYRPLLKQSAMRTFEWRSQKEKNAESENCGLASPIRIRAAWSIVLSQYSGSNEPVFGTTLDTNSFASRRHVVPLMVKVDWQSNVSEWLQTIAWRIKKLENSATRGQVQPITCAAVTDTIRFRNILILENCSAGADASTGDYDDDFGTAIPLLAKCILKAENQVEAQLYFDSEILHPELVEHMLHQFQLIVNELGHDYDHLQRLQLGDLNTVSDHSKALIWSWNSKLPDKVHDWIPNLFSHQVLANPHRTAVDAWDGRLSYAELDYKSTMLGKWLLVNKVAGSRLVLPICFDKTFWTTIALLAAAKIGATFIMIDPYQPRGRLASILSKFDYSGMLARADTFELARSLTSKPVHVINDELLAQGLQSNAASHQDLYSGSAEDPLYIVFTSGSTGEPKGIKISHSNLCSAVSHQARTLGFAGSRSFDSSSYSFDAYVCNTFHTLLTGGCLCVPSEYERINNLEAVLQQMKVDLVQLTPSTSSVLDPASLPLLRTLILTGEKITQSVLDPWLSTKRVRVINAYGPSECTIMCAANTNIACIEDAATIGRGLGARLWIADVNNVERLAPIGAVGELLIEGPIIGQGYLGDEKRTAQSLVCIAGGFLSGIAPCPKGNLFRTGDLAQYNMDGSIRFIGRVDTQIKINGQRVEIGEVEHRLTQFLPEECTAVVEAVEWPSGKKQLIGFIYRSNTRTQPLQTIVHPLKENLLTVLPAYMMPSAYFPLKHIPKTSSGKTDRRTLQKLALNNPKDLIDAYATVINSKTRPLTETEIVLCAVWAETLALDEAMIRSGDNFFSCGGDSLAAIRTVAALNRQKRFRVDVADIFQHPRLSDLAKMVELNAARASFDPSSVIQAFSLLPFSHDQSALRKEAATLCNCLETDIEDIYPCSPVQEEMIVLASRNPKGFITKRTVELPSKVSLTQILSSVKNLALTLPILRTRIIESSACGERLMQVVVKGDILHSIHASAQSCLQHERQNGMGLGEPLFMISLVDSLDRDCVSLILTMHHAVYDGWTLNLISEELSHACTGGTTSGTLGYKSFIQHIQSISNDASASFWSKTLKNITTRHYPPFRKPDYKPISTAVFEKTISGIDWKSRKEVTPTTLVHAAWAMTLSRLSGSNDVVYGTTLLGRQASMVNIERLAGPTLASIPFRAFVDWGTMNIAQFLRVVQQQMVDTIPFMHYGIRNIQKLGYDADLACRFRTFIVIQPEQRSSPADILKLGTGSDDIGAFNSYAMMMECSLTTDGCILRSSFDGNVLSDISVQSSIDDFAHSLKLLIDTDQSVPLAQLPILGHDELEKLTSDKCMHVDQNLEEISKLFKQSCFHLFSDSDVEVVETADLAKQLVGFLCSNQTTLDDALLQALADAQAQLAHKLPRHMLPTRFLAVQSLPRNEKGSIDKRSLAALVNSVPIDRYITASSLQRIKALQSQPPQTDVEMMMRDIWASTLGIAASTIDRESSFLQLGGDSLSAMRVISAARKQGCHFTVADIFRSPCLKDISRKVRLEQNSVLESLHIKPFSLVTLGVDKEKLAVACGLDPSLVEDAYPCSPLQEAMMAKTIASPGAYVSRAVFKLDSQASTIRLRNAWNTVAAIAPILRTRIVESDRYGLLQVVTAGGVSWTEHRDNSTLPALNMALGEALMRFDLVKNDSGIYLHSMIHHAVHDRWSAALILEKVEQVYQGKPLSAQLLPYNYFIRHILQEQSQQHVVQAYWRSYFADLEAPDFPRLPAATYRPEANAGRQSGLEGVDLIAGPTITTIPLRSKIDKNATAAEYMEALQAIAIEMMSFEHYGLAQIQRISPEAKRACQAQASLVIQPPERAATSDLFGLLVDGADERVANEQALALECTLSGDSEQVLLTLNFDEQVVDHLQARRMLAQLEHLVHELGRVNLRTTRIRHLAHPNNNDLEELHNWNAAIPISKSTSILDMIAARVDQSPNSAAIDAWDMSLSYIELYNMARQLAYFLITSHGAGRGKIVPICLEKSVFAPVAMLAVILTGGAAVTMDAAQPTNRLAGIINAVGASIVLASPVTSGILQRSLSCSVFCIDKSSILDLPNLPSNFSFPVVSDEDPLYINFTSGSTGSPKGAIVTHGNYAAAVLHQAAPLGFDQETRAVDLCSYSFDVVWELLIQVLCSGGCLCIPSDNDRFNNISKVIQQFKVNLLDITPSLARTLTPNALPSVRRIIFGGEVLALDDISPWARCGVQVVNAYGPSECTPAATIARYGIDFTNEIALGRCYGLNSWIVSCDGGDNLLPIGAVGELVLEGPLVGKGYLNDVAKTAEAFFYDFAWLHRDDVGISSEGCRRFYKTGDMARYNSQGMLIFEGRKDTQVKIRGQRVELDEIEVQSRRVLPANISIVAEVISAHATSLNTSRVLALFIEYESTSRSSSKSSIKETLAAHLSQTLPAYMVPSTYLFTTIPRTTSGKVHRRQLREKAWALMSERLDKQLHSINKPDTPCERTLSRLWAATLGIGEDIIGRESSFLDLGGDSLTAIRLVGAGRQDGLPLTVALVFQFPQLREMASAITCKEKQLLDCQSCLNSNQTHHSSSFSALEEDVALPSRGSVAEALSLPAELITDVLPLTDFQSYAVSCALDTPRTEWNYISVLLPQACDVSQLAQICTKLTEAVDILRCIFVPYGNGNYAQVFLSRLEPEIQTISTANSLATQCEIVCMEDWTADIPALSSLVKFFIFNNETISETRLVVRIPHAQYDGFSFGPLCRVIHAICDNRSLPPLCSFASYVKDIENTSLSTYVFWKTLLESSNQPTSISMQRQPRRGPSKRHHAQCQVSVARLPQGITPSTMFYAAWGMTVAKVTGTLDVIFGRAVSGRAMSTPASRSRHDNVIGPCINIVPTRIMCDPSISKDKMLRNLQEQIIESIEHENLGLGNIMRKCTQWEDDAIMGSVVYFQNLASVKIEPPPRHENTVQLEALALERPDPPEPPRLDIVPLSEERYGLELMICNEEASGARVRSLLSQMQTCLQELLP